MSSIGISVSFPSRITEQSASWESRNLSIRRSAIPRCTKRMVVFNSSMNRVTIAPFQEPINSWTADRPTMFRLNTEKTLPWGTAIHLRFFRPLGSGAGG